MSETTLTLNGRPLPLNLGKVIKRSKNFNLYSPFKGCYLLQYNSGIVLGHAIFRFQEHYESRKFRNTVFSRKNFKTWWRKNHKSPRFNYPTYYCGYNIRSEVFLPFFSGQFNPLHPLEKEILEALSYIPETDYYVIAYNKGDHMTLSHEACHALYALNDNYRAQVLKVLNQYKPQLRYLYSCLKSIGYAPHVYRDEVNAFLATDGVLGLVWAHKNYDTTQHLRIKDLELASKLQNLLHKYAPRIEKKTPQAKL